MMSKKAMGKKTMVQQELFERLDKTPKEPATDLMKKVAEKTPSKRKILKDFSPEEAREILDEVQSAEKENSKENEETAEFEKQQRELIVYVKRIAKKMEIGNKSKIILFPSYSKKSTKLEWYKMGDFSAQYFAYRMADRMGRTPKLQNDKDRFAKMHVIISIRDVDKFIEQAMRLNEIDRHEETLDKIHILYLKKGLSDEEVSLLRRTEEMRREMMHNVLRPKKALPEMYLTILMIGRQVMHMTEGMHRVYRIEIGDKVAEYVLRLMEVYFDYAERIEEAEVTKDKMKKILLRIRSGMAFLGDNDVVEPTKACVIGENIVKIEELIKELK